MGVTSTPYHGGKGCEKAKQACFTFLKKKADRIKEIVY